MFWTPPDDYEPTAAERDLQARLMPDAEAMERARAAIECKPRCLAVIPLALPGKTRGLWELGQEVVTIRAVWVTTEQTLHTATANAEQAARAWLTYEGKTGTVAYALVTPGGEAAIFEGFL